MQEIDSASLPDSETPEAREQRVIKAIVETFISQQEKRLKPGAKARRALHGKSLGVVEASVKIRELPENLRVGLFAEPKEYRAVMRFSNGALSAETPDMVPNVRGAALKLYDVPGPKLLPGAEGSTEHDFIMANHESFFVKDIDSFLLLTKGQMIELAKQSPATAIELVKATSKIVTSPLDADYFSQVPYSFGDRPCKFALLRQKGKYKTKAPNFLDRDFMRHALSHHLLQHAAKFTLCVQFMADGDSLSDSTKAWTGKQIPLADVTIPRISTDIAESDGESLGFNPYCVLKEHEPLGWPGRLRKEVYAADLKWRNEKNAVAY